MPCREGSFNPDTGAKSLGPDVGWGISDRFGSVTESQAHPDPEAADESGGVESDFEAAVPSDGQEHPHEAMNEPQWPDEAPEDAVSAALVGCTVANRGQLPAARVLRDSFLRHHPDAGFVLLLVDETGGADPHEVRTPTDLGVDATEFARLAMACTAEQLREVLRPILLGKLVVSGATVIYLEPTVQIFGTFGALRTELNSRCPVALVPRVLRPLFVDGLRPSVADLAEAGAFDPSVFAVCPGAEDFLAAWAEQVRADPAPVGAFLDDAAALVEHHVVRDPGVGLSVWNAAQRELTIGNDGEHTVDDSALRSVHFDGFQPQRPWLLSVSYADRPRILLSAHPALAQLCAGYRNALIGAGYTREQPHPYDTLPDGFAVHETLRTEYLRTWLRDGDDVPASPFEPTEDASVSFLEWACAASDERQRAAGASRWTAAVWSGDRDLQRSYPDPFGAQAEAFREWCAGVGVASGRVPPAAVNRRSDNFSDALVDQLGVAVLGNGRLAELVRAAVGASGLPSADTPYYPVVLRCEPGVQVPSGRQLIDISPDSPRPSEAEATEVWVLSEASLLAMRGRSGPPARVVTLPLLDSGPIDVPTRKAARARYGVSEEFVVGAFADHGDERQDNVLGLVSAFFAAFPEREDVRLLVGVTGAEDHPEAAERLRLATAADPRVVLAEAEPDFGGVLAASTCVASLHRTEGDDGNTLRLLEAAARAVPVIAGDHGAVAELIGPEGGRLVPCQSGGEPDVGAAAAALCEAADDQDGMADFGVAAREHLLAEYNTARAGERLRERVEHAYRNWRVQWAKDRHGQLDDPLHPLLVARHALHRAPEVRGGNAMAPALRKAVLKGLSHYDEHIRDILRSLLDGVEQAAAELLRRQYEADGGDLASLRGELTQFGQRLDQLATQFAGTDDGMVRARADLADQHRRLKELESGPTQQGDTQLDALMNRVDSLTGAVEKTLDRVDALEQAQAQEPEADAGMKTVARDTAFAIQRTDVLQRILLREHERNTGSADGTSVPVLCDAGLLRLPIDDSLMLPWLSSHDSWDTEVSALIDSLLEPEGIFLDVGAYVGYQTVRVLSRLGNSGAVVAVEPCERSRELLERNAEVNVPAAGNDRLIVLEGAAWDSSGGLLARSSIAGGLTVWPLPDEGSEGGSIEVRSLRLDRELEGSAALEGLRLSVVHVDVGDRVHRVLGGLVRLLRRDRPSIVCSFSPSAIAELGDDPAAALREFGTWGYELVPVGRRHAVTSTELLEAIEVAGTSTVKLWLCPKGRVG